MLIFLFQEIPWNEKNEFVEAYKQSRRREDDIAIVTSGMFMRVDENNKIESLKLGFGGMAPTTVLTPKTEQALLGSTLSMESFERGVQTLLKEIGLKGNMVPGGQAEFRTSLALGFFYKFFLSVLSKVDPKSVDAKLMSAFGKSFEPVTPRGEQQ